MWELLSAAFAATLCSEFWKGKNVSYLSSIDAHSNNAHVGPLAVQSLILAFERLKYQRGENNAKTRAQQLRRTQNKIKSCVEMLAEILLCAKFDEKTKAFRDYPLAAMSILMDKFVEESMFLDQGMLEKCFPYALLHTAYTDMSFGKHRGTSTDPSAELLIKMMQSEAEQNSLDVQIGRNNQGGRAEETVFG